jgi:hypothetical protein
MATKTKQTARLTKTSARKPNGTKTRRKHGAFLALLKGMKVNDRIRIQPKATLASLRVQTYNAAMRLGITVKTEELTKTLLVTRTK